jgi:hypothetical protein
MTLLQLSLYLPFLHSVVIPLTRTSLHVFRKLDIEIDFVTHCYVGILFESFLVYTVVNDENALIKHHYHH